MNKRIFFFIFLGLGAVLILAMASPALANVKRLIPTNPGAVGIPQSIGSVPQIINIIFKTLITVAGGIFMILLVIGGIQYLTAAGNEEGTAKAKRTLIDAVIGLVIVLAAYAAGNWIIDRLTGQNQIIQPGVPPVQPGIPAGGGGGGGGGDVGVGAYEWEGKLPNDIWYNMEYTHEAQEFINKCNELDGIFSNRYQGEILQYKCSPKD